MNKTEAKKRIEELREKTEYYAKNIMMMIILKYQILNMI